MTKGDEIPNTGILKFVLTAFRGAQVTDVMNEMGDMERCVCIPMDRNGLRQGRTGKVSAYAFVTKTRNSNSMGWTHYLKQKLDVNTVRKLNELGYEVPYLGNMKPKNYVVFKNNYQQTIKEAKVKVEDYE